MRILVTHEEAPETVPLDGQLSGLVIVANRLPVTPSAGGSDSGWETSPGGLVAALFPIANRFRATWVGWQGVAGRSEVPPVHDSVSLQPVDLTQAEVEGYYQGFSNSYLWPLAHARPELAEYREGWWLNYKAVNEKFALQIARIARVGAPVWVHDYHLMLVPGMLRKLRPDLRVGFFLHIPVPEKRIVGDFENRRELMGGLSHSNFVGVQSQRDLSALKEWNESLNAAAIPVSIDIEAVIKPNSRQKSPHLLFAHDFLFLSVDRLDYSKGIPERILAFREYLKSQTERKFPVLLQVLAPTRSEIGAYGELGGEVRRLTKAVNDEFGNPDAGYMPVRNIYENLDFNDVVPLYKAADVLVVSALRDGMNLVAKEFVVSRRGSGAVLVLSRFAGAAEELSRTILIDPEDIPGFAGALRQASEMDGSRARRLLEDLNHVVQSHTALDWALENLQRIT